ncbi:MAG: hypothetical protein WCW56_01865 [Candidatus Paceibacterota bacterium]|jgi:hypothetical protein
MYNFYLKVYKKRKYFFILLFLSVVISVFFALPDLYVDYKMGESLDPIRSLQPNNAHYLTILNAAINSGQTVPNSYLHEQQNIPSHYALLQSIFAHLPLISNIPIALVWTFLRIFVAVAYFLLLIFILREAGCRFLVASIISFSAVCIWGYIRFQSMALGNWYLPPMLLGVYLGSWAIKEGLTTRKRLLLLSLSLLLFSWHAVSFSLGGLAILLLWARLIFIANKDKRKEIIFAGTAWSFWALFLFIILYAPYFGGGSDTAVSTLGRVVQFSKTYLIYHPIETTVVLVATWALLLSRRYGYAFFGLAAIVGLNSNIITGFYFANDHYVVLTEVLAMVAAASLWFDNRRPSYPRGLGILAFIASGWYLLAGLSHLGFNVAFVGRYLVVTLAMMTITALVFFKQPVINFFSRYRNITLVLIFVFTSLYTSALVYKGAIYPLKTQQEAKKMVPLINYLRDNEYSVVLANSVVSSYVALYTKDRVYWSDLLFTDVINDEEILHRWLVSRVFFPNDQLANGELAIDSVYGAEIRCRHFRLFAKPLLGSAGDSFISRFREKDCPKIEALRQEQKKYLDQSLEKYLTKIRETKFSPSYRLDIMVVADTDSAPKDILQDNFNFIAKVGDFSIYKPQK